MTGSSFTFIKFEIVDHGPGYVYITSPDMPGFNLWGSPEEVQSLIAPTIKRLYQLAKGITVEVLPASNPKTFPNSPADEMPVGCILSLAA